MAIVMVMHWPEITPAQYDEALQRVGWETRQPDGARGHVSWFDRGLNVVDVWESPEDFQKFVDQRLMPVLKGEMKIASEPQVAIHPAHRHFVPDRVKR